MFNGAEEADRHGDPIQLDDHAHRIFEEFPRARWQLSAAHRTYFIHTKGAQLDYTGDVEFVGTGQLLRRRLREDVKAYGTAIMIT